MQTLLSRALAALICLLMLWSPRASAQIATPPPANLIGTLGGSVTISASAPSAASYQWQKSTDGTNYIAISGNASATTAALTLTNLQATDAGNYRLVTPGGTSSPAVLKVLPGRAPAALNVAFRDSSQSGATAVTGAAAVGSTSSVWNNLVGAAASGSVNSQALLTNAALVSDSGTPSDSTLTLVVASPDHVVSNVVHTGVDGTSFAPVSSIMRYYTYHWWTATLTLSLTNLNPGATYDLYGYGAGAGNGQGSKWILNAANGGASAEAPADFSGGYTRDVTNVANRNHSYVKVTGTASSTGTLSVVVNHATGQNDPYFNGFQLVPAAQTTITGQPKGALAVPGGSASFTVTAPAASAFQWQSSADGGTTFTTIDPNANATSATATLQLTNVQTSSPAVYRVLVTDAAGIVSYSNNARLSVLTSALLTATPQINVAVRSTVRGGITVTGAGAIGTSGSVWNNLTGAAPSGTLLSQDYLSNAALISDSGAATNVALTLNATSPDHTQSAVMHAFNDGTTYPTVTPIMNYYTYYWWNSTLTLTLTGLRPGTSYDFYGYGTGNANTQGSLWTLDAANGGASATCLADFTSGYTRDVTNPTNQGHSYVKLSGTADSSGNLKVVVDNSPTGAADPYFNGFQIAESAQTTITGQPVSTVTTVGSGATLYVTAPTAQSFLWQRSVDGGTTWTAIDPASNASSNTASLVLTNCQSSDAALYRVVTLSTSGGVILSQSASLSVVPSTGSTADTAVNVAFRADSQSGAPAVTGAAAVGSAGSVWNNLVGVTPSSSLLTQPLVSNAGLTDDAGTATAKKVTVTATSGSFSVAASQHIGNNGTSFSPSPIMRYFTYWWWNGYLTVNVTGLNPGGSYTLYGYGTGDTAGQGSKWIVDPANGGASAEAPADFGSGYTRDVTNPANLNHSYVKLSVTATASGTLTFVVNHATGQNDPYFSGFQIVPQALPTITAQPPANSTATLLGSFSLAVTASGPGTLSYQWQKSTDSGATFANISAAANASAATATLSLSNVQASDAGTYRVLVTNAAGTVISSNAVVTTSSGLVAPTISGQPSDTTVLAGATATFTVGASGTAPLTYQWQTSTDGGANYTNTGTNSPTLSIPNAALSDMGLYRVIVTNSVGSATSNAATLTVNLAPVITSQPTGGVFASGTSYTLSIGVSANPAPTYTWQRSTDDVTYTNAGSGSSLPVTVTAATSGVYRVTITNSVGTVTSAKVFLGAATSETTTFGPSNNATSVNPDTPLAIRFATTPKVGVSGKVFVRKVSDNSVADSFDLGALTSATNGSTVYRYLSRRVGGTNGDTYNAFPIVVVGNEARITLAAGALQYNTQYYVTIEAGVLLDSSGSSYAGISDNTTWRFTTKTSAPTAVPTKTVFTVAADGSGDFSTVQGAIDFIPTGNTTPVRINVANGTYQELINHGGRHNITLAGADRAQTIIQYLNNAPLNGAIWVRPAVHAKGNDLTFFNLSINNATPQGGGQAEALFMEGSRNQVVSCSIRSFQDTMLLGDSTYFFDCLVQGDVDFVWGGGNAMFKNCELRAMGGGNYCQARTPLTRFGFGFVDCTLTKATGLNLTNYGLARNSAGPTDFGNSVFINCKSDAHIKAAGWSADFITSGYAANGRNWEYQTTALDGVTPVDVSQRTNGRQLTAAEATFLRDPAKFFGPTTDGTPAGAQGGGWVPNLAPTIGTHPAPVSANSGQTVNFSVAATALMPITYQWYRNNVLIPGATSATYSIPSVQPSHAGSYTVVVATAAASVTSNAATLTVADVTPPSIAAPAGGFSPLSIATGANGSVALPDYTGQAVTADNVGVTGVTQSPAPGSAQNVGSTHVTLTATDAAENTASISFDVTVTDGTAPTIAAPAGGFTPLSFVAGQSGTISLPNYTTQAVTGDNVAVTAVVQSPAPGSTRSAGATHVVLTASDAAGNSASTSFDVTVFSAVESWRYTYFGTTENAGDAADLADPDGDGLSNLLEFAFGTDPKNSSSGLPTLQYNGTFTTPGTMTGTGQPMARFENSANGVDFRALFVRRKDWQASGINYTVKFSGDLATWQSSSATPAVLADDGTYQLVSVPYPFFVAGRKARFFQVQVSNQP